MELLLTGSTGFVGRNLLLRLAADPSWSRIWLPVRDPGKLRVQLEEEGIAADGRFVPVAVSRNLWQLPSEARPDLAIHAAGLLFGRTRDDYFDTNVEGSLRLAAQLPRTGRLILLSSLAAGGPTPMGAERRTPEHEDAPVSWYGASKLTLERELRNRLGRRLLILRPPMVLGPRDAATVPLFRMARGAVRIKPGFVPKHYSWIDVGALCSAILAVAANPAEGERHGPLYLGSGETITDGDLIGTAAEVVGANGITLPVPQAAIRLASLVVDAVPLWRTAAPSLGIDRVREILPDRWVCDATPFREAFGWRQTKTLRETLAETAAWLKAQGKI
jgi:nucleoside-diphosphate-sugar epimerase